MSSLEGLTDGQVSALPEVQRAERAYDEVHAELLALAPSEVRKITVSVPYAVSVAMQAVPRLMALRAELQAALPQHPIACVDKLETYAMAAYYAHIMAQPLPRSDSDKKRLVDEARALRGRLLTDADALATRQLVDAGLVGRLRSGRGNMDLAGDLIGLGALFQQAWPRIEGSTAATLEEIDRASTLGALLVGTFTRETPKVDGPTPEELRARAFTLLVRAYEQCRRALHYLRFEQGDADTLAPSLFAQAKRRREAPAEPNAVALAPA